MGYGCAFLPSSMIDNAIESKVKCSQYVEEVTKLIQEEAKHGDIVFIGQALRDGDHLLRAKVEYFAHVEKFAKSLNKKGVAIVLLDGTFPPGKNPELCTNELWRPFPGARNCEKNNPRRKAGIFKI